MALTRTVSQLIDSVRKAADLEAVSTVARFPDAEIIDYVNRGIAALWHILVDGRTGQYAVTTVTLTTVSGTGLYALDATFYKLLDVIVTANGRRYPLGCIDHLDRAALTDSSTSWSGIPMQYTLSGSNLELFPTPGGAYAVEVRFIPTPPTLTTGGLPEASFDTVARWDEYIIAFAARLVQQKDENWDAVQILTGQLAEIDLRIRASAPNRDVGEPPDITNVRRAERRRRWGARWG